MNLQLTMVRRLLTVATFVSFLLSGVHFAKGQERQVDVRLQPGFRIVRVADDSLADNVYSLATDDRGNVFVSGPGYIKRLIDEDGDGLFESSVLFSNLPRTGAQGMLIRDDELFCTGDAGLLRFVDSDGNGVADGAPECLLPMQTGGEHTSHALRTGPDGSLYVLAGNQTRILSDYHDSQDSPIRNPRAGFLMKILPDFKQHQLVAHGFRNAYDFDFNSDGQAFVYDSDGERDIALPWYRPTRLFRIRPGDDAGWVDVGWKRPSYFWDMPITLASLGRGSPTGVAVCPAHAFGPDWTDAVLVADWTFGRILACRRDAQGNYLPAEEFASATGQFGFAITDLDFDRDGTLLVCVGGRGTQGAVYRIASTATHQPPAEMIASASWRFRSQPLDLNRCLQAIESNENRMQEAALESMVGVTKFQIQLAEDPALADRLMRSLLPRLHSEDPAVVSLAYRVAKLLPTPTLEFHAERDGDPETRLLVRALAVDRPGERKWLLRDIVDQLPDARRPSILGRLGQLVVGDTTSHPSDPMFAGYEAELELEFDEDEQQRLADGLAACLAGLRKKLTAQGSANPTTCEIQAAEIGRLAAMCGVNSEGLADEIVAAVKRSRQENDEVASLIHWLACYARTSDAGTVSQPGNTNEIAVGLLAVNETIREGNGDIDRNFYPRLGALAQRLFRNDPGIAKQVAQTLPGLADDEYLVRALPKDWRPTATKAFADQLVRHPELATVAQIRVLSAEPKSQYLPLIRSFGDRPELRSAVIEAVQAAPVLQDQELLLAGLNSRQPETVRLAAMGWQRLVAGQLEQIAPDQIAPDQIAPVLVATCLAADRLGWDRPSIAARDELVGLLGRLTGRPSEYQFKQFDVRNLDLFQAQNTAMQEWGQWVSSQNPELYRRSSGNGAESKLLQRLPGIDWASGNARRGELLYKRLRCAECHDGGARLGPRLEGITKRFSTADLFRSMIQPNAQVPDRYRATTIETADGKVIQGSIVYDSIAGVLLQQVDGQTVLIRQEDVEFREDGGNSLMPEGLLDEASDQDWADLNAFLIQK